MNATSIIGGKQLGDGPTAVIPRYDGGVLGEVVLAVHPVLGALQVLELPEGALEQRLRLLDGAGAQQVEGHGVGGGELGDHRHLLAHGGVVDVVDVDVVRQLLAAQPDARLLGVLRAIAVGESEAALKAVPSVPTPTPAQRRKSFRVIQGDLFE